MSDLPSASVPRRHDLDALRAFAMALGIALHASLSFTGFPWVVQDLRPNGFFLFVFAIIHGFRMPLFILVSGYFSMMLWRKRGMSALLKQRFWRVFVPCMLGLVTVVPAMDWAIVKTREMARAQDAGRRPEAGAKAGLVDRIRARDLAGVEQELKDGADPNQGDPEFGLPPLSWAAMIGDPAIARALLDRGANVNGADKNGYRALHSAAFLGHFDVAELLIERGADPKAKGQRGDTARQSTLANLGMTRAIVAGLRMPAIDEEELVAGRAECRQLLAKLSPDDPAEVVEANGPWTWDRVREDYSAFLSSDRFVVRLTPKSEPFHLILTSVFHHLWFLWFLCWLVVIFAIVAPVVERFSPRRLPDWLVCSPVRWLWVVPLTMIPQSLMATMTPGWGPDTSAGLLPQPHLLLYYAIFFGFGAVYYDADRNDQKLGRWWWLTIPLALLVAMPVGLGTVGQVWLSGFLQVTYAWAMCFGLIGLFRRFLSGESRTIRYLSDSAYWLYLAHLPIVIVLQGWLRDRVWPSGLKFLFICTVATLVLLVTYEYLVRYSPIGRLLNGPRKRRTAVVEPTAVLSES